MCIYPSALSLARATQRGLVAAVRVDDDDDDDDDGDDDSDCTSITRARHVAFDDADERWSANASDKD